MQISLFVRQLGSLGMAFRALRAFAIAVSFALTLASDVSYAGTPSFLSVLSDQDVDTYKQMFAAAANGDSDKVIELAGSIKNRSLMGHVAAKGYLSPKTSAEFNDLKAWLKKFGDYPEAERIYALAIRKDAGRAKELKEPK